MRNILISDARYVISEVSGLVSAKRVLQLFSEISPQHFLLEQAFIYGKCLQTKTRTYLNTRRRGL